MVPRAQIAAVAAIAIAVAGVVVAITLYTRDTPTQPPVQKGKPPIPKTLPGKVGAQIEAAFANWPHGSINALQKLEVAYPTAARGTAAANACALVELYRGIGLLWDGYNSDGGEALLTAKSQGWDTPVEIQADNLLHPQFFDQGYPKFQPIPATGPLEKGAQLQAAGHQHSAEKMYAAYAKANPDNDEAQVAAAVGLFNMSNLDPSFAALGALTAQFPKSQFVPYYLGLMLAWTSQSAKAITQFKQTVTLGPKTQLGLAAANFLKQVTSASTSGG